MRTLFAAIFFFSAFGLLAGENEAVSLSTPVVQPGIFTPATVVPQGRFVIGAESQVYFDGQNKFGILGHLRYGLMPSFGLNADLGVNRGEFYFGANVDYQAVHDRPGGPGVLIRGGAFINKPASGLETAVLIGNQFQLINLYGGMEMKLITDPDDYTVFNLLGGIQIPFQQKMRFLGEFGVNINSKNASYLSLGVLFVL